MKNKIVFVILSLIVVFAASASSLSPFSSIHFTSRREPVTMPDPSLELHEKSASILLPDYPPYFEEILYNVGTVVLGHNVLYATDPVYGNLYQYSGTPFHWFQVGTPGKMFAVDYSTDALYALAPDEQSIWQYTGTPFDWIQIGNSSAFILAGGGSLWASGLTYGDIYRYNGEPFDWKRIGGQGKFFVSMDITDRLWGASTDGYSLWEWNSVQKNEEWFQVNSPADCSLTGFKYPVVVTGDFGEGLAVCDYYFVYHTDDWSTGGSWTLVGDNFVDVQYGGGGYVLGIDATDREVYYLYYAQREFSWARLGMKAEALYSNNEAICIEELDTHNLYCNFNPLT